ncbi:MAG: phosphoribosyltransferase [Candidatus Heimdallarchaeota archaeon]|nr:phosphoribosyltransferase [Candidatus Heimdallarchaeota archaeon]
MEFVVQNWQQAYDDCYYLYEKIRESSFEPEIVIGVARGGWIPARLIADFFFIKSTANIKAEAYQLMGQLDVEAKITQALSADIKDKRVLVVDDVADSGATLEAVLEQIRSLQPREVKTAMLYYKPRSSVVPDFFIHETTAWILFSWSIYESIDDLDKKWRGEGFNQDETIRKMKETGLPATIINSYYA